MNFKYIFSLPEKSPRSLTIVTIVLGILGLEPFVTGEIKTYKLSDIGFMIGIYLTLWFLVKGNNWARRIMIGLSAIVLFGSFNADEKDITNIYLHYFELVLFCYFLFLLNQKHIKEYFGLSKKFEFDGMIKSCPDCETKLNLNSSFKLLFGKEFKCHQCHSTLRQSRKAQLGWYELMIIELLFVPLLLMPTFFLNDEPQDALFLLPFFILGIILKLKSTRVVKFHVQDEKYLNKWVKGDEPGKVPTEEKRELVLNLSYEEAFQKCREAIKQVGAKFDWQDLKHGIVRGSVHMNGNSFGELILFNIKEVRDGVKIELYARNLSSWAIADFGRTDFVVENLYKAIKGEQVQDVQKRMNKNDLIIGLSFFAGLLILAKSFDLKIDEVPIIEHTYNGFAFLLVSSLIYFGIYKGFKKHLYKMFERYFCSPSTKAMRVEPVRGILIHSMILPLFAIIHTILYFGNAYMDRSVPEVVIGHVGGLEKFGDHSDRNYCFYVYLDEKEDNRITDQRYCFQDGYQGLRKGDKVKLLSKSGFFGVQWALDIRLEKYESLEKLIVESKGPQNIHMSDISHITAGTENYRKIASVWESECEKENLPYCRLSAYLKRKENKTAEQIKLLRKACSKGDGGSCFSLFAQKYMSSEEEIRFRSKVEAQCENKSPEGCYYWGSFKLYDSGYKDFKSVKSFFEIACTGNVMNSCTDLKVIELEEI